MRKPEQNRLTDWAHLRFSVIGGLLASPPFSTPLGFLLYPLTQIKPNLRSILLLTTPC